MRMRAAVLDRMGGGPPDAVSKPLRVAEVELDPPGRGEVLVRTAAAGLCRSDPSVSRRLHRDGAEVNHHLGCSAFAEHAAVSGAVQAVP